VQARLFIEIFNLSTIQSTRPLNDLLCIYQNNNLCIIIPLTKRVRAAVSSFTCRDTTFTGWFACNKLLIERQNNGEEISENLFLPYSEQPNRWVWNGKTWQVRKKGLDLKVGRMYMVSPREGERYYLRCLLSSRVKCTSWEDVLTGRDGKVCTSFKGSALSWGLLEDDQEWIKCLEEAVVFKSPVALRQLFVILITEELLDNPVSILGQFETSLTDDFVNLYEMDQMDANILLIMDLEIRLHQIDPKKKWWIWDFE